MDRMAADSEGGGGVILTDFQRCLLLVALQRGAIEADPEGQDALIDRLSAKAPWAPFSSLQAWEEYQLNH